MSKKAKTPVPTPSLKRNYDLTATNAVWIALATLHSRLPKKDGFTTREIEDEVISQGLFAKDPSTVTQHIKQHLVATKRANAKPRRMLTELSNGRVRLFIEGDEAHPSRVNSPVSPAPDSLPAKFQPLLLWYRDWSHKQRHSTDATNDADPLLALMGTWTFGDADQYIESMRDGWKGRP